MLCWVETEFRPGCCRGGSWSMRASVRRRRVSNIDTRLTTTSRGHLTHKPIRVNSGSQRSRPEVPLYSRNCLKETQNLRPNSNLCHHSNMALESGSRQAPLQITEGAYLHISQLYFDLVSEALFTRVCMLHCLSSSVDVPTPPCSSVLAVILTCISTVER